MKKINYISITQGSCGIISPNEYSSKGFYTGGIETCAAIIYKCKNGTLFFHDSGQLRKSEISDLINKFGGITEISIAAGQETTIDLFSKRIEDISRKLNFKGKARIIKYSSPCLSVKYSNQHEFKELIKPEDEVSRDPHENKRDAINKLTDLFATRCAEDVRIDIQYLRGKFTGTPPLNPTLKDILELIKDQEKYFLLNIKSLRYYSPIAEIKLPNELIEFLDKHNTDNLPHMPNTSSDKDNMDKLYKEYIKII